MGGQVDSKDVKGRAAEQSAEAVRVSDLHHAYGERVVLRGIDLSIGTGELVAVVGPNGAGKSTLLRLLLGFLSPTSGRIDIGGRPLGSMPRLEIARRAAFVPQGFQADFAFTVRELVAMGRTPHLGRFQPERDEDRRAIASALEVTDTASMAGRRIDQLSGGERQRVLLARAFAQEAPLLVLDEPNQNLDLLHAYQLLALVRERVAGGGAAVAALHDLALAARFCDRMIVLHRGRVHANGAPAEVLTEALMREVFGVHARVLRDDDRLFVGVEGPANGPEPTDPD